MKHADIVIVGGGMVGLALARLLADSDCQIVLLDPHSPPIPDETLSCRVSAINFASQQMLERVGAWQRIPPTRLSPYQQMTVWEKDSFAQIHFDCQDPSIQPLGLDQLGFIVENTQIQFALWQQVQQQANATLITTSPQQLGISETGAFLHLNNGDMLSAKLVVGADGANSWVRQQSHIPLVSQDYQHTALVCNVRTAEKHAQTARQIFAPEGILAFLPLADEQLCSIVWSMPPEQAHARMAMDERAFNQALTIAFDHRLGLCDLQTSRQIYPLVARYARDFAQPRLALVGDAAHTIHPLAGLGVNLGFADVITLSAQIKQHLAAGQDIGEYRHLRYFERKRKAEAIKVLMAMKGLKELFAGDHPVKKLLRGVGLQLTNQSGYLKKQLIQHTLGFE